MSTEEEIEVKALFVKYSLVDILTELKDQGCAALVEEGNKPRVQVTYDRDIARLSQILHLLED